MDIRCIFPVIINTGIHQDSFKPSFKCNRDFHVPVFVKLMNIFEKFGKAFIDDFLNLMVIMLIAVTNFHSISLKEMIQLLLAAAVILSAAG